MSNHKNDEPPAPPPELFKVDSAGEPPAPPPELFLSEPHLTEAPNMGAKAMESATQGAGGPRTLGEQKNSAVDSIKSLLNRVKDQGSAFLSHVNQGATFGGADEIEGAMGALTGGSYKENRDRYRNLDKEREKTYPITSSIGELAGAIASPIPGTSARLLSKVPQAVKIAELLGRAAPYVKNAAMGLGYGYGKSEGDFGPKEAVTNAAAGAILPKLPKTVLGALMGAQTFHSNPEAGAAVGGGLGTALGLAGATLNSAANLRNPQVLKQPLEFLESQFEKKGQQIPPELRTGTTSIPQYWSDKVKGIHNQIDDIEAQKFMSDNALPDFEKTDYYKSALGDLQSKLADVKNKPINGPDMSGVNELRSKLMDQYGQMDQAKAKKYIAQQFTKSITNDLGELGQKTYNQLTGDEMNKVTEVVDKLNQAQGIKQDPQKSFNKFIETEMQVNPKLKDMPIKELIYAKARKTPYTSILQALNSFSDLPDKSQVPQEALQTMESNWNLRNQVDSKNLDKWFRSSDPQTDKQKFYRLFGGIDNQNVTHQYADDNVLDQSELNKLLADRPDIHMLEKPLKVVGNRFEPTQPEPKPVVEKPPVPLSEKDKIRFDLLKQRLEQQQKSLELKERDSQARTELKSRQLDLKDKAIQSKDEYQGKTIGLKQDQFNTKEARSAHEEKQDIERAKFEQDRNNDVVGIKNNIRSTQDEIRHLLDEVKAQTKSQMSSQKQEIQGIKSQSKDLSGQYKNELKQHQEDAKEQYQSSKQDFEQNQDQQIESLKKILSDIAEGRKFYKNKIGASDNIPIPMPGKIHEALSLLEKVPKFFGGEEWMQRNAPDFMTKNYSASEPKLRADYMTGQMEERGLEPKNFIEKTSNFLNKERISPENRDRASISAIVQLLDELRRSKRNPSTQGP